MPLRTSLAALALCALAALAALPAPRGGRAALPAGKTGAKGREPGSPEPASGSGVVVIPQGGPPPGSEFGVAPAMRSAGLGPRGPQAGVSTSGTRGAAAQGPAPTMAQQVPPAALHALRFRPLGPLGGRVNAVAGEPGNPLVAYLGAASGGIFKTTDGGQRWFPVFDHQDNLAIGALAVSPSHPNQVWAGTGDPFFIRSATASGDGIYKSTDRGATWTRMGLRLSGRIARIVVDPDHANIVFAAVVGSAFAPSPDRGLYRSRDGGKSWRRVLFVNPHTGASDVALDPNHPNTVLCGMWQLSIHTWNLDSGGPGSGLYLSHDGGDHWTHLTGHGLFSRPVGKIAVGIAPSDGRRMYALVQDRHPGFYRSDDGGASWRLVNQNDQIAERPPYYTRFTIDPRDPDRIYFVSVSITLSRDGGSTQHPLPVGGDNHDLWINPTDPDRILVADDLGASLTLDRGREWHNVALPIAQIFHALPDDAVPYFVYANQQDSSSWRIPSRLLGGGMDARAKVPVGGCESGFAVPDTSNNQIVYAGCYGGGLDRFDLRNLQTRDIRVYPDAAYGWPPARVKYRWNWTFPIALSPLDHNQIYVGSQFLHTSTDGGASWRTISPDLTRDDPSHQADSGGVSRDNIFGFDGATLWSIAASPRQPGLIWVGSNDGLVHLTRNGGLSWTDVTPHIPGLPRWATISDIEPSHASAATAYLAADDHLQGDNDPLIYKTTDYGATWTAIGGGIPHSLFSSVNCVKQDPARPGLLYAATQNGIFFTLDDGQHWNSLQLNLPHAPVSWLAVQPRFGDLVVSTFGRGIYILDDLSPLRQLTPQVLAAPAFLFVPRPTYRFRAEGGYSRNPSLPGLHPPPNGAILNYFLARDSGTAVLTILDAAGHPIRTLRGPARAGLNRLVWNLRETPAHPPLLFNPPPDAPWVATPPAGRRLRTWDLDFSLDGPMAPPGVYTVRLRVAGQTLVQHLRLLKDPKSSGTEADISSQVAFARQVRDGLDATATLIGQWEGIRRQAATPDARALGALALADESRLFDVYLTGAREDQFRNPDQLWEQWSTLNHEITDDSADFAPTAPQRAALARFSAALHACQAAYASFLAHNLAAYNALHPQRPIAPLPASEVKYAPTGN